MFFILLVIDYFNNLLIFMYVLNKFYSISVRIWSFITLASSFCHNFIRGSNVITPWSRFSSMLFYSYIQKTFFFLFWDVKIRFVVSFSELKRIHWIVRSRPQIYLFNFLSFFCWGHFVCIRFSFCDWMIFNVERWRLLTEPLSFRYNTDSLTFVRSSEHDLLFHLERILAYSWKSVFLLILLNCFGFHYSWRFCCHGVLSYVCSQHCFYVILARRRYQLLCFKVTLQHTSTFKLTYLSQTRFLKFIIPILDMISR